MDWALPDIFALLEWDKDLLEKVDDVSRLIFRMWKFFLMTQRTLKLEGWNLKVREFCRCLWNLSQGLKSGNLGGLRKGYIIKQRWDSHVGQENSLISNFFDWTSSPPFEGHVSMVGMETGLEKITLGFSWFVEHWSDTSTAIDAWIIISLTMHPDWICKKENGKYRPS